MNVDVERQALPDKLKLYLLFIENIDIDLEVKIKSNRRKLKKILIRN